MPASFDTIRTGHKYFLRNHREEFTFQVMEIFPGGNCKLKDLDTLEIYFLEDLVKYGKGRDFEFYELLN